MLNLLQRLASQQPDRAALIFEGQTVNYEALCERVEGIAVHLRTQGVSKGHHVALIMDNHRAFVESLYAIWVIGAVAVPLNPDYTAAELSYILDNGDVRYAIVASTDGIGKVPYTTIEEINHVEGCKPTNWHVTDTETALILYTSGTTGKPKGAMLSHLNLYSNARDVAQFFLYKTTDIVIVALPLFHVFALTVALNAPLFVGAKLIILPRFSPTTVLDTIEREQATLFAGVPLMYNYMVQAATKRDLSSLRLAISGGSPLPLAIHEKFASIFNIQISEGYGLSEASPVTCFNPVGRTKIGTVGTAIPNVSLKIIDEGLSEVATGHIGELAVSGPNVMTGYYKNAEATTAAFTGHYLRTGDLAFIDSEGYVTIIDRKKDLILVGGYNVYPKEVEEVLYRHPDITEVAVVGKRSKQLDEEVVAFVVSNTELDEEDLKAYCAKRLVRYKCPVRIQQIEMLPKNSTGKILKYEL